MRLALAGVLALGTGAPAMALATQGFTGGTMAAAVQANEDWQQSGTCLWRITDGLLEVKPASGSSGILDGFDWKDPSLGDRLGAHPPGCYGSRLLLWHVRRMLVPQDGQSDRA